jgi:hypothetical protein
VGFFKDIRNIQKQAEEMTPQEYKGFGGLKNLASQGSQMMSDMNEQQQTSQQLMATGRVGMAQIKAIRDTGVTMNENPQVEFDLEVTVEGMAPYPVTHRQLISRLVVANFQPGASVPVRVDPNDPQTLMIG